MTCALRLNGNGPIGLYIHVPFCRRLCIYCDFYKEAMRGEDARLFVDAMLREMDGLPASLRERGVATVYLGGGTPTVLGGRELRRLIGAVRSRFRVSPDVEASLEANPEDADAATLDAALAAGVNRFSIGVQSFHSETLAMLSRNHSSDLAIEAIARMRRLGIENLNLDLMIGLPAEELPVLTRTLSTALALAPEHLSIYLLDLAKQTALREQISEGRLPEPDEEESRRAYDLVHKKLTGAGYRHYEISNFAKSGFECRHNLGYWTDRPYLGLGPAAASYLGRVRFTRKPDLAAYLEAPSRPIDDAAAFDYEELSAERAARDALVLGLRLTDAIDTCRIFERYGEIESIRSDLEELTADGLLEWKGERVRIPLTFLPVADSIWARLV